MGGCGGGKGRIKTLQIAGAGAPFDAHLCSQGLDSTPNSNKSFCWSCLQGQGHWV